MLTCISIILFYNIIQIYSELHFLVHLCFFIYYRHCTYTVFNIELKVVEEFYQKNFISLLTYCIIISTRNTLLLKRKSVDNYLETWLCFMKINSVVIIASDVEWACVCALGMRVPPTPPSYKAGKRADESCVAECARVCVRTRMNDSITTVNTGRGTPIRSESPIMFQYVFVRLTIA